MSFFDLALFIALGAIALTSTVLIGLSAASVLRGSQEDVIVSGAELRETVMISRGERTRRLF